MNSVEEDEERNISCVSIFGSDPETLRPRPPPSSALSSSGLPRRQSASLALFSGCDHRNYAPGFRSCCLMRGQLSLASTSRSLIERIASRRTRTLRCSDFSTAILVPCLAVRCPPSLYPRVLPVLTGAVHARLNAHRLSSWKTLFSSTVAAAI